MRATPETARARVLVVDDEENLRASLGQILAYDYDVTVCASGREVLALLAAGRRFDAVLCDLMMPGMSGAALYDAIAAAAPEQLPSVVFLTGGAYTPAARAFMDRVPNPRLEKPFDVAELRAALRAVISA
jgi:CheY-like chemotaxis protein